MNDVLQASLIVAALAAGLGLVILLIFKLFAVAKDERFEEVLELLPGVNCGGCGYSGCAGYAEALAHGEDENPGKCTAGGKDVAADLASYLGQAPTAFIPKVASIACQGSCDRMQNRYVYTGSMSCKSAQTLFGGPGACHYGCLGLGDCERVCEFSAIKIVDGLCQIDPDRCTACGQCVRTCPKQILSIVPKYQDLFRVACSSSEPGGQVRKACSVGCIGCQRCVRACEYGAIEMDGFLAKIDFDKCIHCGACATVCPTKAIVRGLYPVVEEEAKVEAG